MRNATGPSGANIKNKTPERRCCGCGESFPKKELIRVVRTPEGSVELDFTGKKSGRGAYICKKVQCLAKAKKKKSLERSLETAIPDAVYESLSAELVSGVGQ